MIEQHVFIHHVYFWLNRPGNAEDRNNLVAGLNSLTGITSISNWHIGQPANTDRDVIDQSYAVSWLLFFNSKEAQDSYQDDPVHHAFVEKCSPLWSRVVVYDTIAI